MSRRLILSCAALVRDVRARGNALTAGDVGCDPAGPGFQRIRINPQPVGDLTGARASYHSIRGTVPADWRRRNDTFVLRLAIPTNTTAVVRVPAMSPEAVTGNGAAASRSPGVKFLRQEAGRAVYETASGQSEFKSRLE